jgi:hypothetical protein
LALVALVVILETQGAVRLVEVLNLLLVLEL